jgi:hypothetical protein
LGSIPIDCRGDPEKDDAYEVLSEVARAIRARTHFVVRSPVTKRMPENIGLSNKAGFLTSVRNEREAETIGEVFAELLTQELLRIGTERQGKAAITICEHTFTFRPIDD